MEENDPNIEITPVEEEIRVPAGTGSGASVNLRLLTQEEFDRLPKPESKPEKKE